MKPIGLAILFALFLLPLPALAAPVQTAIQPGGPLGNPQFCTLNFVFKDASNTYIGTAGHCAEPDERMSNALAGTFGTVVFDADDALDFALIQVDAAKVGLVSPAMRQWGGPVGTATTATAKAGDPLLLHGYGLGFSATNPTRNRAGVLLSYNGVEYRAETGAVFGDSGGPILDGQDGRAVGIISHFDFTGVPPATDEGPTVQNILTRLGSAGFNVALQTAPFTMV